MTHAKRLVSVVIPVYNEAGSLPILLSELRSVLHTLSCDAEIVTVDDGSTDTTWGVITSDTKSAIPVRGVKLARNFGKEQAIRIGLATARGNAVIVMDGDLQHPPLAYTLPHFTLGDDRMRSCARAKNRSSE